MIRWLLIIAGLALAGCGSGSQPLGETLTLSSQHSTFVFFFTDN